MRIAFVCIGNICRSPVGEVILRDRLAVAGLSNHVQVESFGTAGWHEGEGAHPPTSASLRRAGYAMSHFARKLRVEDISRLDLVLVADRSNLADVERMLPGGWEGRLCLAREFDVRRGEHPEGEVPDPWGHADDAFDAVVEMMERVADGVVAHFYGRVDSRDDGAV